ncbi:CaiB/BaiF CoA transferase family protein [Rhodococcus chondri]|uniref:CaiB/BaiF CoA-transferase family protein n=1 Tax=Rhodococcus chondri TaxID=3065941 RepID=A0ABU7JN40_9NOCA|nr:CaiB/BaiF CoA-transferase family protein [Rhodococcus sp. CC-R104]MEE2031458.1 CaiB/BaiF CoA-transferase family protein [Rhodococcus sp. CC-R104]
MSVPRDVAGGGPLAGVRVVELAGIGPGPHAAMILADLGAEVACVRRPDYNFGPVGPRNPQFRGRILVEADLKDPESKESILALIDRADILIEGFRPGVAERLGLGPDDVLARNPRMIYGRMTGWGQDGPLSLRAGHDINYIALTGLLHAVGRAGERPLPPLNLLGDFGGGSMFLVVGILAALHERNRSGHGQVIDAAMVDGAPMLGHLLWALRSAGQWSDERGTNLLDGGAPFYDTYACADGKYVAVGALEAEFYHQMVTGLGLPAASLPEQHDRSRWAELRTVFEERFATKTRDEWTAVFDGTDACVTPVLDFAEAPEHPHMASRRVFQELAGVVQPAPAPRFSRTPAEPPAPPPIQATTASELWKNPSSVTASPGSYQRSVE